MPSETKLRPITSPRLIRLGDGDAAPPRGLPHGKKLEDAIDEQLERIKDLQKVFYADGRFALLIVLQGRDASGKDGTVKKVMRNVKPATHADDLLEVLRS